MLAIDSVAAMDFLITETGLNRPPLLPSVSFGEKANSKGCWVIADIQDKFIHFSELMASSSLRWLPSIARQLILLVFNGGVNV